MAEPLRVLQVFGKMNRGGAETMIMTIYRNIDRNRIQFDFIVHTTEKCAYDDEIIALGGKIYSVPQYEGVNHVKYISCWKDFFKVHPEHRVIHAHTRSTASIFLKIAKNYGLVTICHSHSTANGAGIKAAVKNALQFNIRADYYFACSEAAGKWLFGKRVNQDNFKVIYNPINAEEFKFNEEKRREIRSELHIKGQYVIGTVGRFSIPKNPYAIISIFKAIHEQDSNTILLWVGGGELDKEIREKVLEEQLSQFVIFTGIRTDVSDILAAMDIFLFPSLWEGLGIVLIEAQASGLKCLVSNAIPKEAKITDLVEAISLEQPAEYWAEKALQYRKGYERADMVQAIVDAGYDVHDITLWLENFYRRVKLSLWKKE